MQQDLFYSDALVDYSGIGKTVNDLRGRFSLLQFLDFCALVEGIVLHDRLIMVGSGGRLPDHWQDALKPLLQSGVLVSEPQRSKPLPLGRPPERGPGPDYNWAFTIQDAWYETGRLLGAEREYKCSSLPLLRQRPFYEAHGKTVEEHSVCDLFGQYRELSEALLAVRSLTTLPLKPYVVVPIPPIALKVLQISRNVDELLVNALEIRDTYARLRTSLRSLREELADPDVAPLQKLRAIKSWQKSWATLDDYKREASVIEVGSMSTEVLDIGKSFDGLGLDSLKVEKLLQQLLKAAEKAFYRWRVRVLHNASKAYLATSDHSMGSEIRRLFGYTVSEQDLKYLSSLGINLSKPGNRGQTNV